MVTVFAIGIVVALLVEERTGRTPGGIIVPGFLALALDEPWRVAVTLGTALVAIGVYRLVEPHLLLYGRRRFAFLVLTGLLLKAAAIHVLPLAGVLPVGLLVIGYMMPGLVASHAVRQGILPTVGAALLATGITRLAALGLGLW
jgi:poly-gamma-glutamate biosynthesis protein PgsC/CapC